MLLALPDQLVPTICTTWTGRHAYVPVTAPAIISRIAKTSPARPVATLENTHLTQTTAVLAAVPADTMQALDWSANPLSN